MNPSLPLAGVRTAFLVLLISFNGHAAGIDCPVAKKWLPLDTSLPAGYLKRVSFNIDMARQYSKTASFSYTDLAHRAESLKLFAEKNHLNTNYGIFIKLDLPSATKRFFVIDLSSQTIIGYGIVTTANLIPQETDALFMLTGHQDPATFKLTLIADKKCSKTGHPERLLQPRADMEEDEPDFPLSTQNNNLRVSPSVYSLIRKAINASPKPILLCAYGE